MTFILHPIKIMSIRVLENEQKYAFLKASFNKNDIFRAKKRE